MWSRSTPPLAAAGGRAPAVGHRHGRNAPADERSLLVRVEGKGEVGELLEAARPRRIAAALLRERGARRLDETRRRRARGVAAEHDPRRARACDRVEIDDRDDVPARSGLGCEMGCAACALGCGVRRKEDEGVRKLDPLRACRRRVGPGELDQGRRPRGVVVRVGAVPVRHDDDLVLGIEAGLLGHEVGERRAATADHGREAVGPDGETVRGELLPEPGCGAPVAGRAGRAVRIAGGEIRGERSCRSGIERGRQVRRAERRRLGDAERQHEQR